MRPLLLLAIALSGCGREPEALPPPPAPVPRAAEAPAPADRIAFIRAGRLWIADADGRNARRIADGPEAAEPAWDAGRRRLAFVAAAAPGRELYVRNVFVVAPDGAERRQVTPMPNAGRDLGELGRGVVRGRAVIVRDAERSPVPAARVSAYGLATPGESDPDGLFQVELPSGGGWVRLDARIGGTTYSAWRFAAVSAGKLTALRDVPLLPGALPAPGAPAWCDGGRQILYVMRHDPADRPPDSPLSTLRRIRADGSGDETVLAFATGSIIAGPVVRGDDAWVKLSDGRLQRIDLRDRRIAETIPSGFCAPDALALSPDGATLATLSMDAAGAKSLLLVRRGSTETLATFSAAEPSPRAMDFSPAGDRLVFDVFGGPAGPELRVLTIAAKRIDPLIADAASPVWHGR